MILLFFLFNYTIIDINVDVKFANPQLIIETSGLKTGEEFRSTDIQNAINNLSRLRLFNYIEVDTTIVGDGIFFKIIVEEAPFLNRDPMFEGNSKIKTKNLLKKIDWRVGQIISDKNIFEAKNTIVELYKDKSFYNTDVRDSSVIDSLNKIDVYFIIKEGIEPRIGKIEITGNNAFTDIKITKMMKNKPKAFLRGGKLDVVKLEEDVENIKSFYKDNGYLDVKVSEPAIEVEDDLFIITINIEENERYYVGDISFTGDSVFKAEQLKKVLKYESGEVYDLSKIEETYQELYGVYADEGYIYCSIAANEDVRDSFIDIEYAIKEASPASIKRVIITGNYSTRENVIRREITTMPGERFRRSDVIRSLREIFNLGFFDNVEPLTGVPDDSGRIDLIYNVTEKEGVATVGAGISYSAQDRLTGYFELSHPNMWGKGQRLYTKIEMGGRLTNFQIGYTEPWLFNTRMSAGIDLYYTNRFWDYYTKRDIGFAGRLSFPFYLDYTRLGYTLRIERTQLLDISNTYTAPTSGYSLYDDTIPKWTAANAFSLSRDSRDFIFNPSSGTYLALHAEIAKKFLFANIDYNRFTFEARTYLPIYWKLILMGRIKAGVVTSVDEVPLYKRFYAGGVGDDGVRGYADRSLSPKVDGRSVGGNALLINNVELKLKLSQSLSFLLFYDAGNSFASYEDVNLHNLYRGVGGGVRIEIPMMGVLGFDMGYGLDSENPGFSPHFQINPFGMF
ncbi:MAG: outer membrane protein assembly factor BamA [bacterium]